MARRYSGGGLGLDPDLTALASLGDGVPVRTAGTWTAVAPDVLGGSVTTPVAVDFASSIAIDATLGTLFRITAIGDLTLTDPTGGIDGQTITVEVMASGADRTLTAGGNSIVIPIGEWWVGAFRYVAPFTTWLLDDSTDSSSGGSGGVDSTDLARALAHALIFGG